ncbi:hypothetical protein [Desulfovibrio sp. JC010]|uniref:AbiTii domain-containing protein n=1 Tax=Desulfovibrio sp. JC010 TaxID=2593641 RepID=UPI0013D24C47|nr:hypothetical protein [Desulfovibrio sp. JC010]NDV28580.1 hypothetical protein [Desulfovibrio sp. JC010]
MTLLYEIQESIVQNDANLGPILLKLRFLASRLGSNDLADWINYESEGYPKNVEVPPYRTTDLTYRGTFSGPFGSGIQNAQIAPYIIEKYAGESWVKYSIRESIATIDDLAKQSKEGGGSLRIDASDLILLMQNKIYEGYACNEIIASISCSALSNIQQAVKNKILELTIELEKSVPESVNITFGARSNKDVDSNKVTHISQQIIYGDVTNAVSGTNSSLTNNLPEGDIQALIDHFRHAGINTKDATELAGIMQNDTPESTEEPLGTRTKQWLTSNLDKAAKGAWKIGFTAANSLITEAALKYYGLK